MKGIKHLIQCHCILPQYKNSKEPVFHKFPVFSILDESDTVIVKYSDCNNCGAVHKVYDICKSELIVGRDATTTTLKKEDFKMSLPQSLYELLGQYNKEICDYEYAQFVIDNEDWNTSVVLTREELDSHIQGKILRFVGKEKFRVESYMHKVEI